MIHLANLLFARQCIAWVLGSVLTGPYLALDDEWIWPLCQQKWRCSLMDASGMVARCMRRGLKLMHLGGAANCPPMWSEIAIRMPGWRLMGGSYYGFGSMRIWKARLSMLLPSSAESMDAKRVRRPLNRVPPGVDGPGAHDARLRTSGVRTQIGAFVPTLRAGSLGRVTFGPSSTPGVD